MIANVKEITNKSDIKNEYFNNKKNTYYVMPMNNSIEYGPYAGRYILPVKIETIPKFANGILDLVFYIELGGQFELPLNSFLCDIVFNNQIIKNIPLILIDTNKYGTPQIYRYQGNIKIDLIEEWTTKKLKNYNLNLDFKIQPNFDIFGKILIWFAGGNSQDFFKEMNQNCNFKINYEINNYFTQDELTKENFNDWKPNEYVDDINNPIKNLIKKIIKPNYYFEPKEELLNLTFPLKSPWHTNARNSPNKEFEYAQINIKYKVINQPIKTLKYIYNQVDNLNDKLEFNLGFKTNYDFDKHEIILVNQFENGFDGIFFPEKTNFEIQFIFKDKKDLGCFYIGNTYGKYNYDFFETNKDETICEELNNNATGNWYSTNKTEIKDDKNF